jgi:hypothetical protein
MVQPGVRPFGLAAPDLDFGVEGVEVLRYAAVPTLIFKLRIESTDGQPIQSVSLNTQIRIAAPQRRYTPAEQAGLVELFGEPRRWADTLKSLLWTHTTLQVPTFEGSTLVDMPVVCTYDFEVASAKYFHALANSEVQLELLFSGTVFYAGDFGLQVARIPWEKEARFALPVRCWKELMEHYFPNSAWLRLRRDVFERLRAYRADQGLPTWEAALERLLEGVEQPREGGQ